MIRRINLIFFKVFFFISFLAFTQSPLDSLFGAEHYIFSDSSGIKTVPYRYYIPNKGTPPYPLLMNLHGSGSRGHDNTSQLNQAATIIFEAVLERDDTIPTVFLAPQLDTTLSWPDFNNEYYITPIIDSLIQIGLVDSNRIYLIGQSRGASGVIEAMKAFPNLISAGVATGGLAQYQASGYFAEPNLWYWQGIQDHWSYVAYTQAMAHNSHQNGGELIVTLSNVGHGMTGILFDDSLNEKSVIRWLFNQSRQKKHTSVQWLQYNNILDTIKSSTFIKGNPLTISANLNSIFNADSILLIQNINEDSDSLAEVNAKEIEFCIKEREGNEARIMNIGVSAKSNHTNTHMVLAHNHQAIDDFEISKTSFDTYIHSFEPPLILGPQDSTCFQVRFYCDSLVVPSNMRMSMNHIAISALQNPNQIPVSNIKKLQKEWKVMAYPQPARNELNFTSNRLPYDFSVYDNAGRLILQERITEDVFQIQLEPGIYISNFQTGGSQQAIKIVVLD
ncbi:MAG: T9SS type A sorting domain-containing protein [Flavobacteriales bacterium]|nr:T9SS type A sorting domain-containing protein [Flavobacteriales bacterium]